MFEVLAFVYENYWGADSCPELPVLQRKLNALGFASPEVINALLWLEDLQSATHHIGPPAQACSPGAAAKRVFTAAEQARVLVQKNPHVKLVYTAVGAGSTGVDTFMPGGGVPDVTKATLTINMTHRSDRPGLSKQAIESQLREALDAGAVSVLLDNFTLPQMRDAVALNAAAGTPALLEVSGSVQLDQLRAIAATGVHRISVGRLTKDVRAVDFSMRVMGQD